MGERAGAHMRERVESMNRSAAQWTQSSMVPGAGSPLPVGMPAPAMPDGAPICPRGVPSCEAQSNEA
jgi:hypothetical protein